jgi:hypothetical protein
VAETIMKQILDLIRNGLSKVISSSRELNLQHLTNEEVLQVKVKILDQLLLWILDEQIIAKLLKQIPRSTFSLLENIFQLEVYNALALSNINLFNKISNIYGYPNHLYENIKSITFKFIADQIEKETDQMNDIVV